MHLHDFEIEGRPEDLRGFAREPEERVHADAVVRREDDRDLRGGVLDRGDLRVGVAGRADDAASCGARRSARAPARWSE